ncbi:hypothetical protein EIP91_007215 [Steccherinum ochraceum]|uniref:Ras-domain-containing protein n=1 Tax=Steccherinum ochraceum TaxID=92696 RepID=A0A4R0R4G2_9APHY|nr:hypothetical protein EIP91_007215 [Steccherinum ochraceum]
MADEYEIDATELLETYDFLMKYIVIGEAGTGKSCLLHQFTHNAFKDHSQHTIGVEFSSRTVKLGEKRIKLQLWDTAGQERFRSVTRSYYRGAAGAILVYDITSRASFANLSQWLADARALASPHLVTVLVGNKSDREEDREVEWAEASKWAAENDVHFLEASSLTGDNVEAPFLLCARSILLAIESGSLDPEKAGSGVSYGDRALRRVNSSSRLSFGSLSGGRRKGYAFEPWSPAHSVACTWKKWMVRSLSLITGDSYPDVHIPWIWLWHSSSRHFTSTLTVLLRPPFEVPDPPQDSGDDQLGLSFDRDRPPVTGSGGSSASNPADPPPTKASSATDKAPTDPHEPAGGSTPPPTSAHSSPTTGVSSPPSNTSPVTPVKVPSTPASPTSPTHAPSTPPPSSASSTPAKETTQPSKPSSSPSQPSEPAVSSHPSAPTQPPAQPPSTQSVPVSHPSVPPSQTHKGGTVESSVISAPVQTHPASRPSVPAPVQSVTRDNEKSSATQSVSTITDKPETTLTTPVFISTTDSAGHLSLSVPPVFTSVGVSTEANGSLVSVTHVIANPTGIWGINDNTAATKKGFFANTGAVAGVFLVVGIIVAAMISSGVFVLYRKRRRRFIRNSISRPIPFPDDLNPFEDPRESPSPNTQMRYAGSDSSHRNLVGGGVGVFAAQQQQQQQNEPSSRGRHLLEDEVDADADVPPVNLPPSMTYPTLPGRSYDRGRQPGPSPVRRPAPQRPPSETMGLAGIGTARRSLVGNPVYNGPFSDYHAVRHSKSASTGGRMISRSGAPVVKTEVTRMVALDSSGRGLPCPPLPPPKPFITEVPSAESSPSIYPVSLPPAPTPTPGAAHGYDDDSDSDTETAVALAAPPLPTAEIRQPTPTPASAAARPRPTPPVIPPRSPLRHSNYTPNQPKQPLLIQTQLSSPQLKSQYANSDRSHSSGGHVEYEPLTPPASLSSDSHSAGEKDRNPFVGYEREVLRTQAPKLVSFPSASSSSGASPSTPGSYELTGDKFKDNFYTRRKNNVEVG